MESKRKKIDQSALNLLCKMASISLTKDETEQLLVQLNSIAELFDEISIHTTMKDSFARRSTILADDIPQVFPAVDEILQNVPTKKEHSVVCPVMKFQGKKNDEF